MSKLDRLFALRWPMIAVFCVAVAAGLGVTTVVQGEGLSYFSTDPKACANCHIMQPHYDGWQKGSHHAVATCSDCHLPTTFAAKYWAKAQNGWHHSSAFTTDDFAEPIRIKAANARALEANCRRCHAALIDHLSPGPAAPLPCVHCHAQVGHPSPAGVGGPAWK